MDLLTQASEAVKELACSLLTDIELTQANCENNSLPLALYEPYKVEQLVCEELSMSLYTWHYRKWWQTLRKRINYPIKKHTRFKAPCLIARIIYRKCQILVDCKRGDSGWNINIVAKTSKQSCNQTYQLNWP